MARAVHLSLEGESGPIDIDSFTDGLQKESTVYVRFFELIGKTGIDRKTGRPMGNREYTGVRIQKRLDKASPALFELFTTNTPFAATFDITGAEFTGTGDPSQVLATIIIGAGGSKKNAFIVSYTLCSPDAEKRVEDSPDEPYEELVFSFDTLEFKKVGGDFHGDAHTVIVKDSHTGCHK